LFLIVFGICSHKVHAGTSFSAGVDAGVLSGFTSYRIGGIDYDPTYGYYSWGSKLEWPINSIIAGPYLSLNADNQVLIDVSLRTNVTDETGKMKDSDYINGYRFIYSESDASMVMYDFNLKGRINLSRNQKNTIGLIGGYRYQDFSFEARNLEQTSLDPNFFSGSISGLVIRYDVKYSIPYVGLAITSLVGPKTLLELSGQLGYVMVKDVDDHVLRYKKSTGHSTGESIGLSGSITHNLAPTSYIRLTAEYTMIEADGKQTQRWYATTSEALEGYTIKDIDLKIESEQTLVSLGVGIRF
jgi:outer membrane protease